MSLFHQPKKMWLLNQSQPRECQLAPRLCHFGVDSFEPQQPVANNEMGRFGSFGWETKCSYLMGCSRHLQNRSTKALVGGVLGHWWREYSVHTSAGLSILPKIGLRNYLHHSLDVRVFDCYWAKPDLARVVSLCTSKVWMFPPFSFSQSKVKQCCS